MDPLENERQRRRPVWKAISNLFLDTALQASDLIWIPKVLAASGYTDQELESILDDEVLPVCLPSLLSPAGEWIGFDLEWLEESIVARQGSARRSSGLWNRYRAMWRRRHVRTEWKKVLQLVHAERNSTQAG